MKIFYDLEVLKKIFTGAFFNEQTNHIDLYYAFDDTIQYQLNLHLDSTQQYINNVVYDTIKNFKGTIRYIDISQEEGMHHFAKTCGCSDAKDVHDIDDVDNFNNQFRLVCDSDPNYTMDKYPYLSGFNSTSYDQTILAMLFAHSYPNATNGIATFSKPDPAYLRTVSDGMFTHFKKRMPDILNANYDPYTGQWKANGYQREDNFQTRIYKNFNLSGRYLDIMCLNETQRAGLKKLRGYKGLHILENETLSNDDVVWNLDNVAALIAYNVGDVVDLKEIADDPVYSSVFQQKKQLLLDYPDLIYAKQTDAYKPDIQPKAVSRYRLIVESTSSKFAGKTLCPYGQLSDIDAVSYTYPEDSVAKKHGYQQINVLEYVNTYMQETFYQHQHVLQDWKRIYDFYKKIEGQNYNEHQPSEIPVSKTSDIMISKDGNPLNLNLIYYNADGTMSQGYVNFSIGGIHGQEFNKPLYEQHVEDYQFLQNAYNNVRWMFLNPEDVWKEKEIPFHGKRLPRNLFVKRTRNKITNIMETHWQPEPVAPLLWVTKTDKDSGKIIQVLNPKYAFTSSGKCLHQDFSSYYPLLLNMLNAYLNKELGSNRYLEVYNLKDKLGKMLKDASYSKEEKALFAGRRASTKLTLNSATGRSDAKFKNEIYMPNRIKSMRIIGQLFSFIIGQKQTCMGATVMSTNTDGLYVKDITLETALEMLERETEKIHVEIEPEPMFLISKDTNNRIELDEHVDKVLTSGGGQVGCYNGPNLAKALSHPAILDWATGEYLIYVTNQNNRNLSIYDDFDRDLGTSILKAFIQRESHDKVKILRFFQHIVSGSSAMGETVRHVTLENPATGELIPAQQYNRVFYIKDQSEIDVESKYISLANLRTITPAQVKKRKKENQRPIQHDMKAYQILVHHNVDFDDYPGKEAIFQKISGIEEKQKIIIEGENLHYLSDERLQTIIDSLDLDAYVAGIMKHYASWQNQKAVSTITYPSVETTHG